MRSSQVPEWPKSEILAAEKDLLGFYVTGHPLTPFAKIIEQFGLADSASAGRLANRTMTRIGGMIAAVQNGVSKKSNKPYAMVTLEDLHGSGQVLCMNEIYDKSRELLVPNRAIFAIGEINSFDEKPKIFPQAIISLEEAPRKFTRQVHLRLHVAHLSRDRLQGLQELVSLHPGNCPLFLCMIVPNGEIVFVEAHERFSVTPSAELQKVIDDLVGEDTYYAKVEMELPERPQRRREQKTNAEAVSA